MEQNEQMRRKKNKSYLHTLHYITLPWLFSWNTCNIISRRISLVANAVCNTISPMVIWCVTLIVGFYSYAQQHPIRRNVFETKIEFKITSSKGMKQRKKNENKKSVRITTIEKSVAVFAVPAGASIHIQRQQLNDEIKIVSLCINKTRRTLYTTTAIFPLSENCKWYIQCETPTLKKRKKN